MRRAAANQANESIRNLLAESDISGTEYATELPSWLADEEADCSGESLKNRVQGESGAKWAVDKLLVMLKRDSETVGKLEESSNGQLASLETEKNKQISLTVLPARGEQQMEQQAAPLSSVNFADNGRHANPMGRGEEGGVAGGDARPAPASTASSTNVRVGGRESDNPPVQTAPRTATASTNASTVATEIVNDDDLLEDRTAKGVLNLNYGAERSAIDDLLARHTQ